MAETSLVTLVTLVEFGALVFCPVTKAIAHHEPTTSSGILPLQIWMPTTGTHCKNMPNLRADLNGRELVLYILG